MSATSHLGESLAALRALGPDLERVDRIGEQLGDRLVGGARLLAVGNGGSAAEAQHLTAELVGRYREDRRPLSALALHAETSSLTAIANDYGHEEGFARQVEAHGREGDTLLVLSTSGASGNVLHALRRARALGLWTIALTGPAPNPSSCLADEVLAVPAPSGYAVQEAHLVLVHLLCEAIDRAVARSAEAAGDLFALGVPRR